MIRRPPRSTRTDTLFPLHDALPISTDVSGAIDYYEKTLGFRLSDRSGPAVAFLHGPHGSDHHLLALVMSDHVGMHHQSWDVGSIQEVGLGSGQMRSEEHKSELQSLMRSSYAVFCLKQ